MKLRDIGRRIYFAIFDGRPIYRGDTYARQQCRVCGALVGSPHQSAQCVDETQRPRDSAAPPTPAAPEVKQG